MSFVTVIMARFRRFEKTKDYTSIETRIHGIRGALYASLLLHVSLGQGLLR